MKWHTRAAKYTYNQKRIKRRFLLFPKTIENEYRWLCWASWEDKFEFSLLGYIESWEAVRWLD